MSPDSGSQRNINFTNRAGEEMTQSEFLFVGNRAGPWQRYSKRLVDSASLQNLPVREEIRSLCQNMSTTSLNALKVQLTFFFPGEKHCIALSFDANS